jgi:alpha-beta hydrolase superfamily lysophospholipase
MQYLEGMFSGASGHSLYYQAWQPEAETMAVVVLVHGLGNHSGSFQNAIKALIPQGYAVYGFDLRGHGKSSGQRGHIQTWQEFRADLRAFFRLVECQQPHQPRFLWGHSLGSVIALDYAVGYPHTLQGVILTGLPIGKVGVSALKLAIGRLLSRVWSRFSLDTGITPDTNSRDPAVVLAYQQDPLRHTRGTARLSTEFLRITAGLCHHPPRLSVPLLMLHGGADRTAPIAASYQFFQQVVASDKEWWGYPDSYHDLHNDLNYQDMLAQVVSWLLRHRHRVTHPMGQQMLPTAGATPVPLTSE